MVQILREIPIHTKRARNEGALPSSRMRSSAPAVAAMLAFLTLVGCIGAPLKCEGPPLERVVIGVFSVGTSELARALECPTAEGLNDLKIKAREGNPDAQFKLSLYYANGISEFYSDYFTSARRSASRLMRCAAEGGSLAAQRSPMIGFYLEEPDSIEIYYKHSKISVQREGCDCNTRSRPVPVPCYGFCLQMRDAAKKLSPSHIAEIEYDISFYEPSPKPCDVEILRE